MSTLLLLGRTMLEIGSVKPKFSRHVAAKNLFLLVFTCICYFTLGYALSTDAYGGVYGTKSFLFISYKPSEFTSMISMFLSCWHCISIASCALLERAKVSVHILIAVFISCLIYPVVVSWNQGGGWLFELGFIDSAGCGSINLVAGTIGLVGTLRLGSRLGMYNENDIVGLRRSLHLNQEKELDIKIEIKILE